ncbi:MAG: hypothetical protein ACI9F9_001808 [Candidatus Paceibacteria bacterium]|jgi:hypothetical protein
MARFIRLFLSFAVTLLLLGSAQAEGLVQLTLRGKLTGRGGAPVEIFWRVQSSAEQLAKDVQLRLHLAEGTTAHDLATLIATRLRRLDVDVTFPSEHIATDTTQLFVESTTLLSLRLAPGMSSAITTCEGGPNSVRFLKPLAYVESAKAVIHTSTFHAHTKLPGGVLLDLNLQRMKTPAQLSEELFELGLAKEFIGDRPGIDSWRPVKASNGAGVTGCSVELWPGESDWGVEVILARPLLR